MALRKQARKREDEEVRRRNKELETDIAKGKMSLANVSGTIADEQDRERRLIEDNASQVERRREKLIQQIPLAFANEVTEDAMEASIDNRAAERASVEEQFLIDYRKREGRPWLGFYPRGPPTMTIW